MSIAAIYILDKKGNILICRHYKGDLQGDIVEKFQRAIIGLGESEGAPFVTDEGSGLVFTVYPHKNILFLAVSTRNGSALLMLEFLKGFVALLGSYFKEVEEESIKDNFVIIYELLDEAVDDGRVQCVEAGVLKEYIKTDYHELIKPGKAKAPIFEGPQTGMAVAWRKEGITYRDNECFLDVVEKVSFTCNTQGVVFRSEITGRIRCLSKLGGMPVVELGLSDGSALASLGSVEFDDVKFHKCVNLAEYESKKNILFVPPDGEFELMTYLVKNKVRPLFTIQLEPISISKTRCEYAVKVTSQYKSSSWANDVMIYFPVPCDTMNPTFEVAHGEASYQATKESIAWKIPHFRGEETFSMEYKYSLPTLVSPNREAYLSTPIRIEFEIPYFTISGTTVKYLRVTDSSGYEASPWVKYITESKDYEIRR